MLSQIKRLYSAVIEMILNISKRSPLWPLVCIHQLRFKFAALRVGLRSNIKGHANLFNLRRNIHRLEKGLSCPNVKSVFAKEYIVDTVRFFTSLTAEYGIDADTYAWAVSVLRKFFSVVNHSDRTIAEAYTLFQRHHADPKELFTYYPYENNQRPEVNFTYDELLQLSLRRRSIRYYQDRSIDGAMLKSLFEIAKLAPSSCNRQSFRYLFFNDKNIASQIAQIPGGVQGYQVYNIVVILGDYAGYFNERDVNAPIIDASLASMAFLYACETKGIGTVCINWPNLPDREKKIRKLIDIRPSEFVIMMIGLGYPLDDGKVPYSKKRNNDDFLLINNRIRQ